MQKQVEVRMDENHLETIVDEPESACSSFCDKIMKNMVLTLTILGKFTAPGFFTYSWVVSRSVLHKGKSKISR